MKRLNKYKYYKDALSDLDFISFQKLTYGEPNYSYFPVIFENEARLIEVEKKMNGDQIFPRKYFYPSVNTYSKIVEYKNCPVSEDIAKRILCLPLYWKLRELDINRIIEFIKKG